MAKYNYVGVVDLEPHEQMGEVPIEAQCVRSGFNLPWKVGLGNGCSAASEDLQTERRRRLE